MIIVFPVRWLIIVKVIKNLSAKAKILLSVASVSTAGVTTCAWVFIAQAVSQKSKIYQFQDKIFKSYDDVVKYANANLKLNHQIEENEMVIYNDVAYGQNLEEMFELIDGDYKIEKLKTYKNPEDYIVLNNNQLSNVAITDTDEKPVKVYKGKNGNAYLNKEEAINTYMQYEKAYLVDNVSFHSLETAKAAVEKEIGRKFESDDSIDQTEVYNIGGIDQTEQKIKKSILQDITLKYEINDIPLDITDSEFKQADFSDLEKKYIKPINSSKAGYWIDFPKSKGTFVGPQFIQTYSDIESIFYTNWQKVDSTSINLLLLNAVLVGEIISMFSSLKLNQSKQWNLKQTFFKNDETLFTEYEDFIENNKFISLKELEFSHQETINTSQQIPMFFKNLIFAKKWYDQFYFQHKDERLYKKIDKIFKQAVSKWLDISILDLNWNEIINNESIEMVSIIDYFLNPQKTVQDTNSTQGFYKKIVGSSQNFLNTIMKEATSDKEKNGKKSKMATSMVQLNKNKTNENNEEIYYDENQKVIPKNEYYDLIFNVFNGTLEALGPLASSLGSLVKKIPVIGDVIDLIWDVGDLLSSIEYVTYKLELEEGLSIFYYTTEYKIPILNLKLSQDNPDFETSKQLLYQSKLSEGVIFNGDFYPTSAIQQAKQDFKSWIAINPEKFATKTFFVYKPLNELSEEIKNNEISDGTVDAIKERFLGKIFGKTIIDSPPIKKYSDGFGKYFDNKESARNSYTKKIKHDDSSNFKIEYKYTNFKGEIHFFDQEKKAQEYIKNYINRQIESKLVLSTDLIVTIDYEELQKIHNHQYDVYQVLVGTKEYLFLTQLDAKAFAYKNVDLKYQKKNITNDSCVFDDKHQFNSKIDFNKWLASQIKIIN